MSHIESKIKPLAELVELIAGLKASGQRIVHSHGAFDLVHPGHIRHLEAARQQGDVLIVTITPDRYINKGPNRPVFNQRLRAENIAALQSVDFVAINDGATPADAIRFIQPDVYVMGSDSDTDSGDTVNAVNAVGAQVYVTDDVTFSSTHLLNAHFDVLSPETSAYLQDFRSRYTPEAVIDCLKSLRKLKVLVIGDAIIDEYHFVRPYGMASKSTVIAAQFQYDEAYAGGSLAIANHIAGFCDQVHLVTCLGEQDSREGFIREHLKPNVTPQFFLRPDAPTVIKRRYLHSFLTTKLFEVSFFNDQPLPTEVSQQFDDYIKSIIGDYDLVLAADFGHGLVGPSAVDLLCREARYLAVNAQSNSINNGYNVITKYPRADYACIDEGEARLAARDRYGQLETVVEQLAQQLQCRAMTVTKGNRGSITYQPDGGFASAPVFSREIIDTTGAGDAYLSLTAPCACMGYPPELIGFVGNVVGALAVRIIGNKESVEPEPLFKFINALLK
ncbi:MAG: adenylyltransferase/cytidyltransferase family protein [Anaerolineae bacterium]|nr:adenylyltransferase/cytidyltransferase family protein [Anaerolineae bacterium]